MVLLLGMTALGAVLYGVGNIQQNNSRKMANLNAMVYSERVKSDIMQEVGVTKALKQLLVSENGRINKFSEVAEDMMMDSIQSIQLAPDGVVTEVYPEEGNEAGKIDLFNDADRGEISRYARDNHIEIMQGPFQLEQGGYGMAVRNPIYLKNENGEEEFWGFTIVSCVFLTFFQMRSVHFRISDMNTGSQKPTLPGAILIKLFISQTTN